MEALTRLVSDSLTRHGFNRPPDPRRLQWSRWFLCDSLHSLLVVPSKPGIFAIAEEVAAFGNGGADGFVRPADPTNREGHDFAFKPALSERSEPKGAEKACDTQAALAAEASSSKRMLAVLQFSEDDDMAYTLDRMFTKPNPMRERLTSGHCFLRFVVIEDEDQRRNICNALNQWLLTSAEKASGIPAGFSSSLEMASVERAPAATLANTMHSSVAHMDSGLSSNPHCPHPLPSGF
jgi:hypothetical protein